MKHFKVNFLDRAKEYIAYLFAIGYMGILIYGLICAPQGEIHDSIISLGTTINFMVLGLLGVDAVNKGVDSYRGKKHDRNEKEFED